MSTFNSKTMDLVNQAIREEKVRVDPASVNTPVSACDRLVDSLTQVSLELAKVSDFYTEAWDCVKTKNFNDFLANVNQVKQNAINVAGLAIKASAICQVILEQVILEGGE